MSTPRTKHKLKTQLLDHLLPTFPDRPLSTSLIALLIGLSMQFENHELLLQTVCRAAEDVSALTVQDMERLSHVISFLGFRSKSRIELELFNKILKELPSRIEEILAEPRFFPSLLQSLALKGVYDAELIDNVFKTEFLEYAYQHHNVSNDIWQLDAFTRINLAGVYHGRRLPKQYTRYLAKYKTHFLPNRAGNHKTTANDRILMEIGDCVSGLFGPYKFAQGLPHYRTTGECEGCLLIKMELI